MQVCRFGPRSRLIPSECKGGTRHQGPHSTNLRFVTIFFQVSLFHFVPTLCPRKIFPLFKNNMFYLPLKQTEELTSGVGGGFSLSANGRNHVRIWGGRGRRSQVLPEHLEKPTDSWAVLRKVRERKVICQDMTRLGAPFIRSRHFSRAP